MTATRYFAAGDPKSKEIMEELGGCEESFLKMVTHFMPGVLQDSPEECKFDHLAHGMTEEFWSNTSRIFRVTVEEVPKEERK